MSGQAGADVVPAWRAEVVRSWVTLAEATLLARRADLDEVNVFPVADSDTGTNLYLTLAEASSAVAAVREGTASDVASAFRRGALLGARGNSGVIVGQYLGAFLSAAVPAGLTVVSLTAALQQAGDAAYEAVGDPVEGTVLTVGRAVGDGAARLAGRGSAGTDGSAAAPAVGGTEAATVLAVLEEAIAEGYRALQATTSQLPVLRAAGVLDAGAWGLLLILDALAESLGSRTARARARAAVQADDDVDETARAHGHGQGPDAHGGGEFEVMYLVTDGGARDEGDLATALRSRLSAVGESVAVVGGDGLWQVHVHTDAPLDALAVATSVTDGPRQVRVRHLRNQSGVHSHHQPPVGLVAVTSGPGLVADLARAGAVVVLHVPGVPCGPELGRAAADTGASLVLVLAATALDGLAGLDGLTGLAGTDGLTGLDGLAGQDHPGRRDGLRGPAGCDVTVVDRLSEAQVVCGAATSASLAPTLEPASRLAEIQRAVAAVRTAAVEPPDDEEDVGGVRHARLVISAAADLLTAGGGLLTAVSGAGTAPGVLERLTRGIAATHPEVDVLPLAGGVPGRAVLLGVE